MLYNTGSRVDKGSFPATNSNSEGTKAPWVALEAKVSKMGHSSMPKGLSNERMDILIVGVLKGKNGTWLVVVVGRGKHDN